MTIKLYGFWRSLAAYRVRVRGLALIAAADGHPVITPRVRNHFEAARRTRKADASTANPRGARTAAVVGISERQRGLPRMDKVGWLRYKCRTRKAPGADGAAANTGVQVNIGGLGNRGPGAHGGIQTTHQSRRRPA